MWEQEIAIIMGRKKTSPKLTSIRKVIEVERLIISLYKFMAQPLCEHPMQFWFWSQHSTTSKAAEKGSKKGPKHVEIPYMKQPHRLGMYLFQPRKELSEWKYARDP